MSTKQSFHEWLKSGDNTPFQTITGEDPKYQELFVILRFPINESVDLLVYRRSFNERFDYSCKTFDCGVFYQKKTDMLFNLNHDLKCMIKSASGPSLPHIGPSISDIKKEIQLKLNAGLAQRVKKREDLSVSELSERGERALHDARQYAAAREARKLYLEDKTPQDMQYIVAPGVDDNYNEFFVAYITNPDNYIQKTLDEILANEDYQREFLYTLMLHEVVVEEYNALLENKQSDAHLIKRIITAMDSCPEAKKVSVVILKDGHEFTFKTEARVLRWDTNYYPQYSIEAQDRRKFAALFGSTKDYQPSEIKKIVYKRKTLYSKS